MTVIHLITGLGCGGAESMLLKTVPNLDGNHVIISLTNNDSTGKIIEQKGIKVYYLGLNRYNLFPVILRYRKLLRRYKPDIVVSYLIHSNLFNRIISRLCGVDKIYCSVRNNHSTKKMLSLLDRCTRHLVTLYIPNSPALLPYLKQQKITNYTVIPNGVNVEDIQNAKPITTLTSTQKTFVTVARLQPQKNLMFMLETFKQYKHQDSKLYIVGEGPLREKLQTYINKHKLNAYLLGQRADVAEILASCDVFILPSLHEGMSNALLEAMAARKTCLVSNIKENTALIKHGTNGLTFDPYKHKELLDAMKSEKKFGDQAADTINKNYSITSTIKKWNSLLSSKTSND